MTLEDATKRTRLAELHDRAAPYWAVVLIVSCLAGLSTGFFDLGSGRLNAFWKGYVLDIAGPAWNYVLFRRLSHAWADNRWTRFFTPWRTFFLFTAFVYGVEGAQYLGLYESTFDPWDLLAYISLMLPLFVIDLHLQKRARRPE